jgi:hypothetical protein
MNDRDIEGSTVEIFIAVAGISQEWFGCQPNVISIVPIDKF